MQSASSVQDFPLGFSFGLVAAFQIADTAFCRAANNKTLPAWINPNNTAGEAVFETLVDIQDWAMYADYYGGWR